MKFKQDYTHIKSLAIRFCNVCTQTEKDEYMHKQIVKLGSVLIFLREWYDIHNQNKAYATIWKHIEEFLLSYDIQPRFIGKYVALSESVLTQTKETIPFQYHSTVYLHRFSTHNGRNAAFKAGVMPTRVPMAPCIEEVVPEVSDE